MKSIEEKYMERVMAMSPGEKMARAEAMSNLTRTAIARSVVNEHGEMPERELKLRVALRLYGSEPVAGLLIEEELRKIRHNQNMPPESAPQELEDQKVMRLQFDSHDS